MKLKDLIIGTLVLILVFGFIGIVIFYKYYYEPPIIPDREEIKLENLKIKCKEIQHLLQFD